MEEKGFFSGGPQSLRYKIKNLILQSICAADMAMACLYLYIAENLQQPPAPNKYLFGM